MADNAASEPAKPRSRLPDQHRLPAYLEDYQVGLQTSVRPAPPAAAAASRSRSHHSSPSRSAVGPDSSGAMSGKRGLQQPQDELDEELSDLDDWPEALQPEASQVETSADKLKRKYWWKNIEIWAKLIYILAVIGVIILFLLIVMWISPEKS